MYVITKLKDMIGTLDISNIHLADVVGVIQYMIVMIVLEQDIEMIEGRRI